ncbi:MAG: hypothetical protein NC133_02540 [Prevotella sp.]|nr:hypothetical protein [Prevotella sp.]
MKKQETNGKFLDENLITQLREILNATEIFECHDNYKHNYNLFCVVLDRLDSCVRYLNGHIDLMRTEEDFINILVYAAILRDGINMFWQKMLSKEPPYLNERQYFSDVKYKNGSWSKEVQPTDDVFFEYLRAMAFAHPFETSKHGRTFFEDGENQSCPWVISHYVFKNDVGFRMYTNKDENNLYDITFPYENIKKYIQARYNTITDFISWANKVVRNQNELWKQEKVTRDNNPIQQLQNIKEVLKVRFQDTDIIDEMIYVLNCKSTLPENEEVLKCYKNEIIKVIPDACNALDNLEYEKMCDYFYAFYPYPKKMHQMAYYQLEKIFSYLDTRSPIIIKGSDEEWGLIQLKQFMQGFAKNWVKIDDEHMCYGEMKLLVRIACYMEAKKQKENR